MLMSLSNFQLNPILKSIWEQINLGIIPLIAKKKQGSAGWVPLLSALYVEPSSSLAPSHHRVQ